MITEALEDIDIAFRQLEFAIKMLSFCELGKINPSDFDTDHLVILDGGNLSLPSGHFADNDSITRAAGIGVLIAFSATALVLDKAFEIKGVKPDPEDADDVRQLRTLIYMVRCAQAHGIADARWNATGKYRRTLNFDFDGVPMSLDLRTLNETPFDIDQIGGYLNWYRIRDSAVRALTMTA